MTVDARACGRDACPRGQGGHSSSGRRVVPGATRYARFEDAAEATAILAAYLHESDRLLRGIRAAIAGRPNKLAGSREGNEFRGLTRSHALGP